MLALSFFLLAASITSHSWTWAWHSSAPACFFSLIFYLVRLWLGCTPKSAFYQIKTRIIDIFTCSSKHCIYWLTFWYKINKKYFFPEPNGRKKNTDQFYPAWGKMGHFTDGLQIDIFGARTLVFVFHVEKDILKCPLEALNCIQKLFEK